MKKIFYFTLIDYARKPTSSSLRILNVCKAINNSREYSASIISFSDAATKSIDGVKVFSSKKGVSLVRKILNYVIFPFSSFMKMKHEQGDIGICYGLYGYPLIVYLILGKIYKIKMVFDAVEWYNYNSYKIKYFNVMVWSVYLTMNYLLLFFDGLITISHYLENYYSIRKKKTLFLPPITVINRDSFSSKNKMCFEENYLNLVYTGIPGKKDYIEITIKGTQRLFEAGEKIKFHIFGCTYDNLLSNIPDLNLNKKCILCYGYIGQKELTEYMRGADFSVLIRDEKKRYAKAGFSTKFVHSLSVGLPVISNLTGDIGYYLKDNFNGYILEDASEDAFVTKIRSVLNRDKQNDLTLRKNAFQTAFDHFRVSNIYTDKIVAFLNTL